MEVVVKLKRNAPPAVKKAGMFLKGQKITRTGVKVKFDSKKEWLAMKESSKFKFYMQECKGEEEAPEAEKVEEVMNPGAAQSDEKEEAPEVES